MSEPKGMMRMIHSQYPSGRLRTKWTIASTRTSKPHGWKFNRPLRKSMVCRNIPDGEMRDREQFRASAPRKYVLPILLARFEFKEAVLFEFHAHLDAVRDIVVEADIVVVR